VAVEHTIEADPIRLQQVLWNLIKNAIKFTPSGGTVTIRSRDEQESDAAAARLVISVCDTGIGIDPDVLPRIFGLFEQGGPESARRYGGLGLGLTISRSIVEQHGGQLVAASDGEGQGATFTFHMPAISAASVVPTVEPLCLREEVPRRRIRILLVDDNADTLESLAQILTRRGHDVHTATSVAEALRTASTGDIDLLITDVVLPDGTGLQLMAAIRASRMVAGIVLSGFGSYDDIGLSRSAGFVTHLVKPVEFHVLEEAIEQATADSRAGSLVNR
jgi:two-component system CheB/CheR fusion protein